MAHRKKDPFKFCSKCFRISLSCSCLRYGDDLFINPLLEDDTTLDLGNVEAQAEYRKEAQIVNDLDIVAPLCQKSDQHSEFIPVNNFKWQDLPRDIQHLSFYVWLRNCIPLVVRILGQQGILATGRASLIPQNKQTVKLCQDRNCRYRESIGAEHEIYGGIGIITNKHVVQNDLEAMNTLVEFFYHDNENRIYTIMQERGDHIYTTNHNFDYTIFTCFTHKKDLLYMIKFFEDFRNHVWQTIPRQIRQNSKCYAIIISHPHGTFKKVSIGNVIGRTNRGKTKERTENVLLLRDLYNICERDDGGLSRFAEYMHLVPDINIVFAITWYTTATCSGSSGGPVFMGNVVMENGIEINQAHTHRGVDHNTGYNNCFI